MAVAVLGSADVINPDVGADSNVDVPPGEISEDDGGAVNPGGSTSLDAIFNLSKTIIGGGIFTMPSAYKDGGFFYAMIMMVLMGMLIYWTMCTLVQTGLNSKIYSFNRLCEKALGRYGSILYIVTGFVFAYGVCITYTVIVADSLPSIIANILGMTHEEAKGAPLVQRIFMDRRVLTGIATLVVLVPVSSLKVLKHLSLFSLVGILMFGWAAITAMVSAWNIPVEKRGDTSASRTLTTIRLSGVVGVMSRVAFASVCHHNQFMIYRSLKRKTMKEYKFVALVSVTLAVISGLIFSSVVYFPMVNIIEGGNVLKYLPQSSTWVQIANAAFAIDVMLTYPLEMFVVRYLTLTSIYKTENVRPAKRILWTIALVFLSSSISVLICDINDAIDYTAGLAASIIAFVLPPLCRILIVRKDNKAGWRLLNFKLEILSICFGLFMAIVTLVTLAVNIKSGNKGSCEFILL